jgi:SAM-dependent methyltransferase
MHAIDRPGKLKPGDSRNSVMTRAKVLAKTIPVVGPALTLLYRNFHPFIDSQHYWQSRYQNGGDSGRGSYGRLAQFKAEVLNTFIAEHGVQSVVEFGCGDGNQLSLGQYRAYVGFDPAPVVIQHCRDRFAEDSTKTFELLDGNFVAGRCRAELALSLDVIYHLIEDSVFEAHMQAIFKAAGRYVIIYSDDRERPSSSAHIRHRRFSPWISNHCREWRLIEHIPNRYPYNETDPDSSWADFWIYGQAT